MKFIFVTPFYYTTIGGVQNYVRNISENLKRVFNHEVIIVTTNDKNNEFKQEILNGLKVYRLPYWFKISNTPINLMWYFQIRKIIQIEKPDIINAHTPVPFMADIANLVKGKTKFALTYHNDLAKSNLLLKLITKTFYKLISNKTIKEADVIIATSQLYTNNSVYLKNYKSKITIVPPGVDTKLFNTNNINADLNKKYYKNKVVLFVGNLDLTHQHKGLSYLLESVKIVKTKIPNVKLLIVGNGDGVPLYKSIVRKHKIDQYVDFYQNVSTEKLPNFYNTSDVVVLPSTDESEGFGMVLIEAMGCGKPVVGSRVGGIPYVIADNETGLLVEPKDSNSLSQAIAEVLSDRKLAERLGRNGYEKIINNFTWEKQISKTNELFKSL